jgi:hypothetical protein
MGVRSYSSLKSFVLSLGIHSENAHCLQLSNVAVLRSYKTLANGHYLCDIGSSEAYAPVLHRVIFLEYPFLLFHV